MVPCPTVIIHLLSSTPFDKGIRCNISCIGVINANQKRIPTSIMKINDVISSISRNDWRKEKATITSIIVMIIFIMRECWDSVRNQKIC